MWTEFVDDTITWGKFVQLPLHSRMKIWEKFVQQDEEKKSGNDVDARVKKGKI